MNMYDHGSVATTSDATLSGGYDHRAGSRNAGEHHQPSSDHLQLKLSPFQLSNPNKAVEVDLGSGLPCKLNVFEPLRVIVDEGDSECCKAVKDYEKSSAVPAKECNARKDGFAAASSSYPSPSNKLPEASFKVMSDYVRPKKYPPRSTNYYRHVPKTAEEMDAEVEYDMDEMVCNNPLGDFRVLSVLVNLIILC